MALDELGTSRRGFLKASAVLFGAVGIAAFPPGLTKAVGLVGSGASRVTITYPRVRVGSIDELVNGRPVDFDYPLQEHSSFLVKLGTPAQSGVGPNQDIVAFSYICSHMGCPMNGLYKAEHNMLGPCPCHYSRFDLAKGGIVILGQATQSLPQVTLETEYREIFATGITGLVYGYFDNLEGGTPLEPGSEVG